MKSASEIWQIFRMDLAGIIMLPDTMFVKDFESHIIENIRKYATCPVVSVRQRADGFYNVLIEDDSVLDDIIHHFIEHHGFTRINFLTGPKENPVSTARLNAFKRIMASHDLPVEEDRVYYGDFWKVVPYDAVSHWLADPDPKKRPEAIICANDYMAVTVCNALTERGILVPGDIAVSGCDNIEVAEDFSPPITTVGMPVFEMGTEAVNKIYKHNHKIHQEECSYLKSITYIRESCGCRIRRKQEYVLRRRNRIINEVENKDKAISNNAYMSIDLTGVTMLDILDSKLASYTYLNEGFASFYMCLYEGWDSYIGDDDAKLHNKCDTIMEVGMKNGDWLQKVRFNKRDLLPPVYMDAEPQFFYFNMLHHQEKCYGYTAISFYKAQAYKPSYQGWLINVCNALENVKIHSELNRLVYRLEDMSVKDELTGLYNRRALQTLGQKYLEQSIQNHGRLMVFSADMDNLKYINDNYGHAKGDLVIKTVADALFLAAKDDEICIRMGGDEFSVIGVEYDDSKMTRFVTDFEEAIKKFNRDGNHGFKVSISYGWSITQANEYTKLEECLNTADARMYQQKYEKEALRLRHLE